jgi:hypothetical protein
MLLALGTLTVSNDPVTSLRFGKPYNVMRLETLMNTQHPIRFRGPLESRRRRPGLAAWLVVALILLLAAFIPSFGWVSLALFVAFYLPAALGSVTGWFIGGLREELRTVGRGFRRSAR